MKTYVILLFLMLHVVVANAAQLFWVGTSSSDWNDKNNWSTVSGGAGGAGVPGASDDVYFDQALTPYNCVLNNTAVINNITISGGALSLGNAGYLTVQSKFALSAGTFDAGTGKLNISSNQVCSISGGKFKANQGSIYLKANLSVSSISAFDPGTSTVTMDSASNTITLDDPAGGSFRFYNLVINKQPDDQSASFNQNFAIDSFQVDNLLTLTNGKLAGDGFFKIEKDLVEASTFDGSSIPIGCTGANTSNLTLNGPLAAGGPSTFVGIVKNTSATVVNVYRGNEAGIDDTIRIGNGGNFTVLRGTIQFPDNSPVISYFNKLIIQPEGTFKSTSNYFYNKGGHANYGGQFLHNNGTYVFANSNVNSTEVTNHVENFYNVQLNCTSVEPTSKDSLVVNGKLTLVTGVIDGSKGGDATIILKGDLNATTSVAEKYLISLSVVVAGNGDQHFFNAHPDKVDFFNCPVTIDKPSGQIILDAPFNVSGYGTAQALIFKKGIIKSATDDNYLKMDQGSVTGASNASHVDGPFKYKSGWSSVEYPVGNGGFYAPVRITEEEWSNCAHSNDYLTVRYFRKNPSPPYDLTKKNDPVNLKNISNCEYWTIDKAAPGADVNIWLSYDNTRSCGIANPSNLRVARWDGSQWTNGGNSSSSPSPYVKSTTYYNSFGPFTLASTDGGLLPVTFLSFKVTDDNGKAYVQWSTANEVNNDHFEVERSSDGRAFEAISKIYPKDDNASAVKNYSFVDQTVGNVVAYYRIKQVDIDGKALYSSVATYKGVDDKSDWSVSYNSSSKMCTVFFDLPSGQCVDASIYSVSGQLILKRSFVTDGSDRRQYLMNAEPGVYFVRIATQNNVWVKQFIVQ
ncbi:T9SS type A sorting domain-containing protein [Pinibacter soli]|uniref:T9SS type A sorting domain-containing protein n=1 Tax=Pinibacter soli TaxID=3044211 RepID=A0ABT6R7B9_9BACT|nr:T9SS type A sorting domain-containing protein [Pinibacter soli]MDI3318336.1 T9SS type A sorting domain-containing protein [Pinibacter soli]